MTEVFLLMFAALSALGLLWGGRKASNIWTAKAKSVTRKEHRGKLYWVIEDGDTEKLDHVIKCFDEGSNTDVCRFLPGTLVHESGGDFGFVCLWRKGYEESTQYWGKVGDFLSQPENQSGSWYIDGGWGGPPGPIRVDWDEGAKAWRNKGFPPWD